MKVQGDLGVKSGRILTPAGWFAGTVVVRDGRIAGLVPDGGDVSVAEAIDVGEKCVIPGLVDTHVHFRDPGFTEKEDFETGSRAAAAGGVTTVVDMPNVDPPTNTVEAFTKHIANASKKSLVDFGHNASGTIPENIAGLVAAGATNLKVFMMVDIGREYPHPPGTALTDHATLFRVCEEVAKVGSTLLVHPHDQDLYALMVERSQARWGLDFRSYARAWRAHDGVVIDSAIATLLQLQRVTGVRLHILHVSTVEGWHLIGQAKARGQAVTAEVNPHALFVAHPWENIERLGPYALGSWVPDDAAEATWRAVADGGLADVIATDHAPHTREQKELGWTDMYACPGGLPFIQEALPLLLTEVNRGRLSLERLVDLYATNPAKLTGLFPKKGAITPGADGDLVVLDLDKRAVVSAADRYYSKCGWTANEGRVVQGVPVMTILRGQVIMKDGEVMGEPGYGQFQYRVAQDA